MSDYNRATRECAFGQLRPELVSAIREIVRRREMGNIEAEILACCETTSEKKKRGLFGSLIGGDPDPVHYIGALVTPSWLVWARSGVKTGTVVLSARLAEIEITELDPSLQEIGGQSIEDHGITVFGFVNRSPERVSAFIGLGKEPAAQRFREVVKEAAAKARK